MSKTKSLSTVRNAALSLWQSCIHRVISRGESQMAGGLKSSLEAPIMEEASAAASERAESHAAQRPSLSQRASTCARLFARLAVARFLRHPEEVALLESEVRFMSCDPLWFEVELEYQRALLQHQQPFYRRYTALGDFVLPPLPDEATVALIADWGTGMPDAQALLEQIASFSPEAVIHLGDIYYSGTPHEVRAHFLDVFERVFGDRRPRVLTLAGNHDRYSGGEGYRELLEALGQPSSYFCLRNAYWQFLAMDTGYHDRNPLLLANTMTWIEDSEVSWLLDKVAHAGEGSASGQRGTILLSHHPLFTFVGVGHDTQGRPLALNPHLHGSLAPALGQVALWFWGHEHTLHIFEPYAGLARGRCIGAGAVPQLVNEKRHDPIPGLIPAPGEAGPPRQIPGTTLGNDGFLENHSYVILTFQGPRLTARYYQAENRRLLPGHARVPSPPLYEETVTLPSR